MHAIKGSWVGQTFALAKSNDFGGKKSRIRRSKEERKTMVESFIKTYQLSNNGNFPSLNLTHKEVGGSFYTVREIVREIILENRVLGPAKFTPEGQDRDLFSEQNLLGSIAMQPGIHMSNSTIEIDIVSNHLGTNEEMISNFNGQYTESEHQRVVNDRIIDENHEDERNNEAGELICEELRVSEKLEASTDKNVVEKLEASTDKVSQLMEDVIVETFPLRPVVNPTYSLDGMEVLNKADSNGTLKEELEPSKVDFGLNKSPPENSSCLVDEKAMENLGGLLLETNSDIVNRKAKDAVNLEDQSVESPHRSKTKEVIMHDVKDCTDLEESHNDVLSLHTSEQGQSTTGIKPTFDPNGILANNLNGTNSIRTEESISKEVIVRENKVDMQPDRGSQKGSNPTLDRINLESWEVAYKKSAEPESNPLLAFFKALVAGFVKFWSE